MDAATGGKFAKWSAALLDQQERDIRAYLEPKDKNIATNYMPFSVLDPLIQFIDDIIEDYIAIAKLPPSFWPLFQQAKIR